MWLGCPAFNIPCGTYGDYCFADSTIPIDNLGTTGTVTGNYLFNNCGIQSLNNYGNLTGDYMLSASAFTDNFTVRNVVYTGINTFANCVFD